MRPRLNDMRNRSKRLRKIVALAEMEERRCSTEMGKSQQDLNSAVSRLEELTTYRQAYHASPTEGNSFSAIRWQDYQNFLGRLDQAVSAQRQFVLDSEQHLDAHRQRWKLKRQRLKSLEQVLERYRTAELTLVERALQKALDDLPLRDDFYDG